MILAIDVGNTNIVLGCIEDGDIRSIVRIQTNPGETAAEYAIKLKQILEIYNISPRAFEGAIISSVVPPLTNSLKEAVRKLTGIECLVVGPGMLSAQCDYHSKHLLKFFNPFRKPSGRRLQLQVRAGRNNDIPAPDRRR